MSRTPKTTFTAACPLPISDYPEVTMAHGAGGALTKRLIDEIFAPLFRNDQLDRMHDGAVLHLTARRTAFTTDSYVVNPLFFPGGDIGSMAVYGTVNDLAMCGARAQHLSLGLIIEEGLAMETLWSIAQSIAQACVETNTTIVTGDTKVVDRGKGDGVFINTAGVGAVQTDLDISPAAIRPGDGIILSGDIGRHGIAVLSAREHLDFETEIKSDCAPVHEPVLALLGAGAEIHCLRDLTRGGGATALIELADKSGCDITIEETKIPVDNTVRGATELLGLDPLYIANEGRFVVVAPARETDRILSVLRKFDVSKNSKVIGSVAMGTRSDGIRPDGTDTRGTDTRPGVVSCQTALGGQRPLDLLTGDQMPRIC